MRYINIRVWDQKINFWLPFLFKIFGLLAIRSFADRSFPIIFYEVTSFSEGEGSIFLEVSLFSWHPLMIFAVLNLTLLGLSTSYLDLGRFSFRLLRFLGNFIVCSSFSSTFASSYASCFNSSIFVSHSNCFVLGRSFWSTHRSFPINSESYLLYIVGKASYLPTITFLYNFYGVSARKGGFNTAIS